MTNNPVATGEASQWLQHVLISFVHVTDELCAWTQESVHICQDILLVVMLRRILSFKACAMSERPIILYLLDVHILQPVLSGFQIVT